LTGTILGRRFALLPIIAVLVSTGLAQEATKPRPYVILVSLDGFRYDYAERYHAANLLAIARAGAAAQGLIPVFPSVSRQTNLGAGGGAEGESGQHVLAFDRRRNFRYPPFLLEAI
jgi:hypothetical protein